jgi:uncharacterized protein
MRKIKLFGISPFVLTILFFLQALLFANNALAQNIIAKPNPATLVTDVAGVLSPEQKQALENKLVAIDDSSSNQIAVVIIPSLDGYPKEEYANKLLREWGIGSKKNNGVLLLISINDRQIWIEVGYGLEGAIPDITALNIIDNDIKPAFKAGNYYEGIDQATDNIAKAAVGEYKVAKAKKSKSKSRGSGGFLIILIIIFLVLRNGRGGGGSNIGGSGFSDVATGMLLGSLLGGGGRHGGGGGFGGGGGGFGGFGGGSSGGGGAGGSW